MKRNPVPFQENEKLYIQTVIKNIKLILKKEVIERFKSSNEYFQKI